MRIEDEIKQSKFNSEYQKLGINILFTANWISHLNLKRFKPYSLTPQQYNVLRILRGQHPNSATINLIIDRMLDKTSNASRLVDKLQSRALVDRIVDPSDRRSVKVTITQAGLDLLAIIDKEEAPFYDVFSNISEEEAVKLNTLLDKLRG